MRRMLSPNVSAYKLRGCSIVDATYYQKALKSKLLVLAGAAAIALGLCLLLALCWRASSLVAALSQSCPILVRLTLGCRRPFLGTGMTSACRVRTLFKIAILTATTSASR